MEHAEHHASQLRVIAWHFKKVPHRAACDSGGIFDWISELASRERREGDRFEVHLDRLLQAFLIATVQLICFSLSRRTSAREAWSYCMDNVFRRQFESISNDHVAYLTSSFQATLQLQEATCSSKDCLAHSTPW